MNDRASRKFFDWSREKDSECCTKTCWARNLAGLCLPTAAIATCGGSGFGLAYACTASLDVAGTVGGIVGCAAIIPGLCCVEAVNEHIDEWAVLKDLQSFLIEEISCSIFPGREVFLQIVKARENYTYKKLALIADFIVGNDNPNPNYADFIRRNFPSYFNAFSTSMHIRAPIPVYPMAPPPYFFPQQSGYQRISSTEPTL